MVSRCTLGITMSVSLVALALFGLGFDEPRPAPSPANPVVAEPKPDESLREFEKKLEKVLEEESKKLKPLPLIPIPDDPPPHEGAMIDIPYVVEPHDFISVEVLEALPGRPITGSRLVRPDGTIVLGMYGNIYVRGLTLEQIKTKIILHLRKYLNDEVLGLVDVSVDEDAAPVPAALPDPPIRGDVRHEKSDKVSASVSEPAHSSAVPPTLQAASLGSCSLSVRSTTGATERSSGQHASATRGSIRRGVAIRRASQLTKTADDPEPRVAPASQPTVGEGDPVKTSSSSQLQVPSNGSMRITIEVTPAQPQPDTPQTAPTQSQPSDGPTMGGTNDRFSGEHLNIVRPADSARVLVDMDSYNSKHYYVLGDVTLPGRYPCTGNDTILDVCTFVGGFLPTADPNEIRLVRPARGEAPARVYKIDWKAVTEQGEQKANLQVFPGDRIYVGRSAVVKATVELNRAAEPISLLLNQILTYSFTMRALSSINQPYTGGNIPPLTSAQREALLKDFAEFFSKHVPPGNPNLSERALRDTLIRRVPPPQSDDRKDK